MNNERPTIMKMPLALARLLGSLAERTAAAWGLAMAIAVVDEEGLLQYFARMEGTLPASTDIAIAKAYTAAALRMSTREVGRLAQPGNPLYGIESTNAGKIVLFGGGFPLLLRKSVAGGLGISGGTVQEDEEVGGVVLDSLTAMEALAAWIKPLLPGNLSGTPRLSVLEPIVTEVFGSLGVAGGGEMVSLVAGGLLIATQCRGRL